MPDRLGWILVVHGHGHQLARGVVFAFRLNARLAWRPGADHGRAFAEQAIDHCKVRLRRNLLGDAPDLGGHVDGRALAGAEAVFLLAIILCRGRLLLVLAGQDLANLDHARLLLRQFQVLTPRPAKLLFQWADALGRLVERVLVAFKVVVHSAQEAFDLDEDMHAVGLLLEHLADAAFVMSFVELLRNSGLAFDRDLDALTVLVLDPFQFDG